jgi:serine/threonine protein kinase
VKPGNIFVDATLRHARLGDFGSAARIEADGKVAGIEGSPLYTPPEARPVGGRMGVTGDVYGAGLTAFEMLNGPFDYAAIDPEQVDRRLTRGLRSLPAAAFVFGPHVPAHIRTLIRKAIRASPAERFQTAAAFIRAIQTQDCIDWVHSEGSDLDGTWKGTWPPHAPANRRRQYVVNSYILSRGSDRRMRRLEALQANNATARYARFGVDDSTLEPDDRDGVDRFFAAVAAMAAHRVAPR